MKIITNNTPRDVLSWWDLTGTEREEFDYLNTGDDPQPEGSFMRYKGHAYDLSEFMRVPVGGAAQSFKDLAAWDGYASDSYFSGVVVKFTDDCEGVIVGTYIN